MAASASFRAKKVNSDESNGSDEITQQLSNSSS